MSKGRSKNTKPYGTGRGSIPTPHNAEPKRLAERGELTQAQPKITSKPRWPIERLIALVGLVIAAIAVVVALRAKNEAHDDVARSATLQQQLTEAERKLNRIAQLQVEQHDVLKEMHPWIMRTWETQFHRAYTNVQTVPFLRENVRVLDSILTDAGPVYTVRVAELNRAFGDSAGKAYVDLIAALDVFEHQQIAHGDEMLRMVDTGTLSSKRRVCNSQDEAAEAKIGELFRKLAAILSPPDVPPTVKIIGSRTSVP